MVCRVNKRRRAPRKDQPAWEALIDRNMTESWGDKKGESTFDVANDLLLSKLTESSVQSIKSSSFSPTKS